MAQTIAKEDTIGVLALLNHYSNNEENKKPSNDFFDKE